MKNKNELYRLPTPEILYKALNGDNFSVEKLLLLYDPYINRLCTMYIRDGSGNLVNRYIDEDKKQIVSIAFITAVRNFAKLLKE